MSNFYALEHIFISHTSKQLKFEELFKISFVEVDLHRMYVLRLKSLGP